MATGQRLMPGNWLDTPTLAATAIAEFLGVAGPGADAPAPNLAVVRDSSDTIVVFSRPAGHTRSTVVWAVIASRNGPLTAPPSTETNSRPDWSRILPM